MQRTTRRVIVEPTRYRITVRGRLTDRLGFAFAGLTFELVGSDTVLVGEIRDQSHLYGVLDTACSLGLELIDVVAIGPADGPAAGTGQ
jgi:hypothetical protein